MANEKEAHQPSRIVGSGIAVIMNVLDVQGNIATAPAFPRFVIFLKHESGFGR
ncbi:MULTISPECIES: hypothetical protein [Rhizobium]|uniref:hypothetical protein n=1 Tax=Rhizobium TaxID=379 RepID=UPI001364A1AF|nr:MULTISPECIES: hypothetical protein [Rhizobium]